MYNILQHINDQISTENLYPLSIFDRVFIVFFKYMYYILMKRDGNEIDFILTKALHSVKNVSVK